MISFGRVLNKAIEMAAKNGQKKESFCLLTKAKPFPIGRFVISIQIIIKLGWKNPKGITTGSIHERYSMILKTSIRYKKKKE